ncbi:MAG: ThuA domain-containing protein [Treponema sp.]|jgi:trehalose utilization protein|nr:ThuA domain-containing protein [Treponema sp.]
MSDNRIRVTVWNEYGDGQKKPPVSDVYPEGLHETIAGFLNKDKGITAKTAVLSDPEQGLSEDALNNTDVLVWWGHMNHHLVEDQNVARVVEHVLRGMGVVFLHSAHISKPFKALLGTSGHLSWREADERTRLWAVNPAHPIAEGVPVNFVIDHEEMYSEPFGIPEPQTTVFISWFQGGNVFRSGVTFQRENGRIFYFQPGHETNPTYHNEVVQRVITNAVKWARPCIRSSGPVSVCPNDQEPLEKL